MKGAITFVVLLLCSCDSKGGHFPFLPASPASSRPRGRFLTLALENGPEAQVGRPFEFSVRIKNVSDRVVDVFPSLDGSDIGMRFPLFIARFWGPDGREVLMPYGGRCGNCNGLRRAELLSLKPGESFDPFAGKGFIGHNSQVWTPRAEGKHRLVLTVDYSAPDPWRWNGPMERMTARRCDVGQLLARVPLQRMEATLEFDVSSR